MDHGTRFDVASDAADGRERERSARDHCWAGALARDRPDRSVGDGTHVNKRTAARDPIREILDLARDGTIPPLDWTIERSHGGQIDPVSAAWMDSIEPAYMADCLEELRPDELYRVVVAVLDFGHAALMDALRRRDSGGYGGGLFEQKAFGRYRVALEQVSGARGDIHRSYWVVQNVAEAIAWLSYGMAHSAAAGRMVADVIRAQIAPLTMPELIARIERGPA
jgi:hypothetical protein